MAITPGSNRYYKIGTKDDGNILEVGSGSTGAKVGVMVFQFNPDINWVGSIAILGRLTGITAVAVALPFLPIPYRQVTINNVASDYSFSSAVLVITSGTKIQVPSNMDSIGL